MARLLWLLAALAAVRADSVPGAVAVNFEVYRGDLKQDMGPDRDVHLAKRDGGVDLEVRNQNTFYRADVQIGLNAQRVGVLLDTGSSDLWVMSSDVNCQQGQTQNQRRVPAAWHVPRDMAELEEREPTRTDEVEGRDCNFLFCFTTIHVSGTAVPSGFGGGGGGNGGNGGGFGGGNGGGGGFGGGGGLNTCTQYGSFDTGKLSSWTRNSLAPPFQIQYADGSTAQGTWGQDAVSFGLNNVLALSLAVVNQSDSNVGVLGIGLSGLEVTSTGAQRGLYVYENLPVRMKALGLIKKVLYSLYLDQQRLSSGTVLFGAVDHKKYSGLLSSMPLFNIYKGIFNKPIRLDVVLQGVDYNDGKLNHSVSSTNYPALLDLGTTLTYMPGALLQNVALALNGRYSASTGFYQISCNPLSSAALVYKFAGVEITVPLSDLVVRLGLQCFLGIQEQLLKVNGYNYCVLGDNFLRLAYVVYDLEDLSVLMAQVKYTGELDVQVVGAGDQISGASLATAALVQSGNLEALAALAGSSSSGGSGSGRSLSNNRKSLGARALASWWTVAAASLFGGSLLFA